MTFTGPRDGQERGIRTIYQELNLVEALSVAENVFLGDLPRRPRMHWRTDRPELRRRTAELLARVGSHVSPETPVRKLSVAQKQMVEIARALARQRPRADPRRANQLVDDARRPRRCSDHRAAPRSRGVGIVYISHRLEEVFAIAQRVTVLRDGKLVGTLPVAEATEDGLVRMMVGRDLSRLFVRARRARGQCVLDVRGLRRVGRARGRQLLGARRRGGRAWRGWSAQGEPNSPAASSGPTAPMPARSSSTGSL